MRLTLVLLASSVIALTPMGSGIHGVYITGGGTFAVAANGSIHDGGESLTHALAGCDASSAFNGLDAHIYSVGAAPVGHNVRITMSATLDVDGLWYDVNCVKIAGTACSQGFFGAAEQCPMPAGAKFILAHGFAGTGSYTISM